MSFEALEKMMEDPTIQKMVYQAVFVSFILATQHISSSLPVQDVANSYRTGATINVISASFIFVTFTNVCRF
nr:hypothetical protein [Tanacetum cinerariifolium]